MKRTFASFVGAMLLGSFSNAFAGIIFVPVDGVTVGDLNLATVQVHNNGGQSSMQFHTDGLTGELTEACGATGQPGNSISFTQQLQFSVDTKTGSVTGSTNGSLMLNQGPYAGTVFDYQGQVEGMGYCWPFAGEECGQMVVNLNLRAAFTNPADPSQAGVIRIEILGSMLTNQSYASWVSYTPDFVLGADLPVIEMPLTSMGEGESCGV